MYFKNISYYKKCIVYYSKQIALKFYYNFYKISLHLLEIHKNFYKIYNIKVLKKFKKNNIVFIYFNSIYNNITL